MDIYNFPENVRHSNVRLILINLCFLVHFNLASSQTKSALDTTFNPSGKLWGYAFGDYYYKAHTDLLNRGGANQYTGVEQGRNAFQFKRIYLGYNYNISQKFSAEILLAAEDNVSNSAGTNGDLLSDDKLAFYVKYANVRWKNIWKGTDLVIGHVVTPAFPLLTDAIWGYRSVERTISDMRRTLSTDFGATLQGKFDPENGNYGYNLMIGNGTGARPEINKFKSFYGDVYAKLFNQKLVLDLYADYQRLHWIPGFHNSRNMIKGFAGYVTPAFTLGLEALVSHGKQDVVGNRRSIKDTTSANARAISLFAHGSFIKDKLGFFCRFDSYNPNANYNTAAYTTYTSFSPTYEPNNKEQFFTAGLDFTPIKDVHFMPNVWYMRYKSQQTNLSGSADHDYDLVYRITFYFLYGRKNQ